MTIFVRKWGDSIHCYGTEKQLKKGQYFLYLCANMWAKKTGIKLEEDEIAEIDIVRVDKT